MRICMTLFSKTLVHIFKILLSLLSLIGGIVHKPIINFLPSPVNIPAVHFGVLNYLCVRMAKAGAEAIAKNNHHNNGSFHSGEEL